MWVRGGGRGFAKGKRWMGLLRIACVRAGNDWRVVFSVLRVRIWGRASLSLPSDARKNAATIYRFFFVTYGRKLVTNYVAGLECSTAAKRGRSLTPGCCNNARLCCFRAADLFAKSASMLSKNKRKSSGDAASPPPAKRAKTPAKVRKRGLRLARRR